MFSTDSFNRNSQRTAQHMLIEVHRCVLVLFDNGPSRHSKGEMLKESQRSSSDFLGLSLSGPEQDFLREK